MGIECITVRCLGVSLSKKNGDFGQNWSKLNSKYGNFKYNILTVGQT